MDGTKSREALAAFLTYLADKGLMQAATVQNRKAAVAKIFSILDEDEAKDVTVLDLDHVVERFGRLHGKNYTPASLAAYRSRLKSAVDDFKSYLANPLAFRPSVAARTKPAAKAQKEAPPVGVLKASESHPEPARAVPVPVKLPTDNLLPIQIRADLTVFVQGIPFDLSETEARKIANVVIALAG